MRSSGSDDTLPADFAATLAAVPDVEAGSAPTTAQALVGSARWELREVIGRGGMGTVHLARDVQFGRDVALKQMHPEMEDRAAARRFVLESLVTGNLEHPGIPAVHERGERNGRLYYAMRRVQGRTLTSAVKDAHGFEERLALLPSVVQVAHTLGFAHERGVVHRDVKPDNVMLGKHGETILLDWGIARVRHLAFTELLGESTNSPGGDQTSAGSLVGTPAYMAPEQADGQVEEIDERTDVFALGAMLYFVLTGSPPYVGSSAVAVLTAASEHRFIPLSRAAPRAAPELREIVETAMAKDPGDRYPNASAFAEALQGFLTSRVRQRASKIVRATGTAIGLAVMMVVAATLVTLSDHVSSFEQQGWSAYAYDALTLLSVGLAIVEWRTKGINHLAPLILAFAIITVLFGISGTVSGIGTVVNGMRTVPAEDGRWFLLQGIWEISGNLPLAALMASIQLLLWALVRRVRLLARDAAAAG